MGPGLLESIYDNCVQKEFELRSIPVKSHLAIPLVYRGFQLPKIFQIDMLVEDEIILEFKSVESLIPVHEAQIISYIKLTDKRLGLLINFNVPVIKSGIRRFVNNF